MLSKEIEKKKKSYTFVSHFGKQVAIKCTFIRNKGQRFWEEKKDTIKGKAISTASLVWLSFLRVSPWQNSVNFYIGWNVRSLPSLDKQLSLKDLQGTWDEAKEKLNL